MSAFWTALWPALLVASAGIASVGQILLTLLLLSTARGAPKVIAYAAGMNVSLFAVGTVAFVLGRQTQALEGAGPASPTSAILALVLGGALLFFAARTASRPKPEGPPAPPKLFGALDDTGPLKLFIVGLVVGAINVKNMAIHLAAVGIVVDAPPPMAEGIVMVAVLTAVLTLCITGPLAVYLIGRKRAEPLLQHFRDALTRHQRPVMITVLIVFAAGFLLRGGYLAWLYAGTLGG